MSERYSILKPLTMELAEVLTVEILGFFAPLNAQKMGKLLGKQVNEEVLTPLSVNDFFKYMETQKGILDIRRYQQNVLQLIKRLEQGNFLCSAGVENGFTLGGEKCYYFTRELSNLQQKNLLWLGECLGLEFILHKTKNFVIPITGEEPTGKIGIGTGTLINSDTILTCSHVLNDMKVDKTVNIGGRKIEIAYHKSHDKVDVGIVKLTEKVNLGFQLIFGDAMLLDEILTMGYPPVPMTRDCYLISQKGEVNSLVQNYDGIEHFIYSSITRPGNSGGPIFTNKGHIVGITSQHVERESDKEKNVVPFFQGITSNQVIQAIHEIDQSIEIAYEDYN